MIRFAPIDGWLAVANEGSGGLQEGHALRLGSGTCHRFAVFLALSLSLCSFVRPGVAAGAAPAADELERGFVSPPRQAQPWAYWWWLKGSISKPGITRDLEEFKRQGINGVVLFSSGGQAGPMPLGPVFMSPEWKAFLHHALHEADRLGITVGINLCDGWDCGGPWITKDQANKRLVYSEVQVDGPAKKDLILPLPPVRDDYYRDVAVVAYRDKPDAPVRPAEVTASSNLLGYCDELNFPPEQLCDGDPNTYWSSAHVMPTMVKPVTLTFRYHEELAAGELRIVPVGDHGPRRCELQASADGKNFMLIRPFEMEKGREARIRLDGPQSWWAGSSYYRSGPTQARYFRLVIRSAYASPVQIAEVRLLRNGDKPNLRPGIKWWLQKSGARAFWDWPPQGTAVLDDEYPADGVADCHSSEIVDLTSRMDAKGRLHWDPPKGRWTILRFGYTLLGQKIRNTYTEQFAGYEADMLSSAGIESHFKGLVEPLLKIAPECVGRSLKVLHIDSYEIGADVAGLQPTWSHIFREEFRQRRGYDVLRYLPALAGKIVDSRGITDRFLWDIRRTIADLMAEKFWGRYVELTHQHGLKAEGETGYGSYPLPQIDALQCAGALDVPMGEFWLHEKYMTQLYPFCHTIRTVSNAAHVYGRPIVQSEAFTTGSHFMESPADLKALGDEQFCAGLNRIVFHQSTHQAQLDFKPGWQYGAGTHIDRCLTWWDLAAPYFQYLARCQYLLQAGRFHADVCYFYGEGAAAFVPAKDHLNPPLPPGNDFDAINADVLMNRLRVENGRLVLPNGQSYPLLVLPANREMSPRVLKKIIALVEAGATVLGDRPLHAPGLTDYPRCDEELKRLADRIWETNASGVQSRKVGLGWIERGTPFDWLRDEDFTRNYTKASDLWSEDDWRFVDFIHRSTGEAELYFVASRSPQPQSFECEFRVAGRQPEIWDPVSGEIRNAVCFQQTNEYTILPLEFPANGSLFIVFRKPIPRNRQGTARSNFPTFSKLTDLGGPWTVHFDPKWGGPESIAFEKLEDWTKRPEEGVKFYSGKATYVREFDLPAIKPRSSIAPVTKPRSSIAPVKTSSIAPAGAARGPLAAVGPGVRAAGDAIRPDLQSGGTLVPTAATTDGPKAQPFTQPRATPWGSESRNDLPSRPNGPTVRRGEPLARWADNPSPLSSAPQGDALGWENRRPFGAPQGEGTAENGPHPNPLPKGEGTKRRLFLDLGTVKNIAQVRLNGRDLGVVWTAPWRVEITDVVRPAGNRLEIDVVNVWANRIMHDWTLPPEKRLTKTNVSYPKDQPLLPSGLLGPVTLQMAPGS